MARVANPEVQYRKLGEALEKLRPEQKLRWILKTLAEHDPTSLLMGNILDSLTYYVDDRFPVPAEPEPEPEPIPASYTLNGSRISDQDLIETACGFEEVRTVDEAVLVLLDQGFSLEELS